MTKAARQPRCGRSMLGVLTCGAYAVSLLRGNTRHRGRPVAESMVRLTLTHKAKAAFEEYCRRRCLSQDSQRDKDDALTHLAKAEVGSPTDHQDLVEVSKYLTRHTRGQTEVARSVTSREWRLETLLKGATIYQTPTPPQPEPVRLSLLATICIADCIHSLESTRLLCQGFEPKRSRDSTSVC